MKRISQAKVVHDVSVRVSTCLCQFLNRQTMLGHKYADTKASRSTCWSISRFMLLFEYQISDSDGKGQPHGTNRTSFVPH